MIIKQWFYTIPFNSVVVYSVSWHNKKTQPLYIFVFLLQIKVYLNNKMINLRAFFQEIPVEKINDKNTKIECCQ